MLAFTQVPSGSNMDRRLMRVSARLRYRMSCIKVVRDCTGSVYVQVQMQDTRAYMHCPRMYKALVKELGSEAACVSLCAVRPRR